jgi:ABC-2 type transport system ATP-binding protein
MIDVRDLRKHYQVHRREPGMRAALRSLFRRRTETVKAVDGITFHISPGERVGFLGPNGAGKTTTLKVLSGLLHPTSGSVAVGGHEPRLRASPFLREITLVMGQKQQLLWDLPPSDTFLLNRAIYEIPKAQYDETVAELTRLLELGPLLGKPTRQLSLGERMKCELAVALLHRPRVLFLDEPTIGLDVSMQATVRNFVREYNERFGATVLLTSHYMDDVTALCPRVIVIDHGRLIYDGVLDDLVRRVRPDKRIVLRLAGPVSRADLERLGRVVEQKEASAILQISKDELQAAVGAALSSLPLVDLTIEDPPLEDVMRDLFAQAAGERAAVDGGDTSITTRGAEGAAVREAAAEEERP